MLTASGRHREHRWNQHQRQRADLASKRDQSDGMLAASDLTVSGNGNTVLDHAANDVVSFTANTTGGQVKFRDANDLAIAAGGITTGGNPLAILTGR